MVALAVSALPLAICYMASAAIARDQERKRRHDSQTSADTPAPKDKMNPPTYKKRRSK